MAVTGKPAIETPRALDLRMVQNAISNTRQRIEQLERALNTVSSVESFNSLTTQVGALRSQLGALSARVKRLEDADTADTVSLTAVGSVTAFSPVVAVGLSSCELADPSDPNRMFGLVGLATNNAASGAAVIVQRRGPLTVPGSAFFIGRAVYATVGGLTQTPNYEATALPVGVAITGNAVWIAPDWPALLDRPFASGVDDAFLRYLPVTYELLQDFFTAGRNRVRVYTVSDIALVIDTRLCVVNAGTGAVNVTLAAASLAGTETAVVTIHRQDAGSATGPDFAVTISPQSGESIGTQNSLLLENGDSVTLLANGFTGWVPA
jgi:Uncharacterized conserved protein (DUF2190)